MTNKEISDTLWAKQQTIVTAYQNGIEHTIEPIEARVQDKIAFFPGGNGYFCEVGKADILVLGQDFSTVAYFEDFRDNPRKQDTTGPTWRNMLELFKEANIDLRRCFFSNVFMGLRPGDKMTGKSPVYKNKTLLEENVSFLREQISVIHPKVIITLGKYPVDMLLRAENKKDHKVSSSVTKITEIETIELEGNKYIWVALVHPSMRNLNVRSRKYKGHEKSEAEEYMLIDALE